MRNTLAAVLLALAVTLAVAGPLAWRVAHDDTTPPDSAPTLQRAGVDEGD